MWSDFVQDLRRAARRLMRSPGFTLTAILTLALGVGASTAIFTIVDSIILEPLSYSDSGRLVALWERVRFMPGEPLGPNPRHVDIWRQRASSFSGVALFQYGAIGLAAGTEPHPRMVGTVLALPNLFEVLDVAPILGRGFVPEEGVEGRERVAILSYSLWQSAFQGDPKIVGKSIRLGGVPREVVGVLPSNFHFPNRNALRPSRSTQVLSSVPEPSIFVPAAVDWTSFSWNGDYGNWIALGRLRPGVTLARAQAELDSLEAQIATQEMPASQRDDRPDALRAHVQPMQEAMVSGSRTGLWLLMASVLGLMLIACVNLANAQLARTFARHREASIRTALGAPRWRLVWSSLTENLLLAAAGGTAGVLLAGEGVELFRRYSPVDLPRLSEVRLNWTVMAFSLALTAGATLLFSILPARNLLRTDPRGFLQQSSSRLAGNSRASNRLHRWLIGLQVFGCTALLLVTGLFAKSLLNLIYQDKGFATERVAFAQVNVSGATHGPPEARVALIDGVLEDLRAVPGLQAAGFVSAMPLEGESWIEPLQRSDRPEVEGPLINLRWVSPGYFETMGHKLVAGRFFEDRDRESKSAVLSEGEAKALWPNQSPLGGAIRVQGRRFTVIGVVADSRSTSLKSAPAKTAYLHYVDRPPATLFFMARGVQPAEALVTSLREAIWKRDAQVAIARAKTLDAQVSESLAGERFQTFTLMSFGVSALLLAMLGIHGMLSYSVTARKQEIGVRMALGATRGRIYGHTFGEAGAPVLIGLAAGLVGGLAAARVARQTLHGAGTVDTAVMAMVAGLFFVAAFVAGLLPARRAASVDPAESLRSN